MRLIWLNSIPYVVTQSVPRHHAKADGMQCLCCGIVRRATPEDVRAWRSR